ncbi:MAG: ABC transporter substrate-binding protein [Oleiphilaceae bacterium]|nr:ABC transporter substrate-binding protein [Oleiphilaceae bacterium]
MKIIRLHSALIRRSPLVSLAAVLLLSWASPTLADLPKLTVSVLQFGTAHWELDHLERRGLDQEQGFDLEVRLVANLPASRLALSSGGVDGAVADLLWVQSRYAEGERYRYLPFSSQLGDILVREDSPVTELGELAGKRIGVAGGPDSKGWILLQEVAAREDLDLSASAQVQYAAPPLLSQALKRGQLDVLITYWHFAARLRAEGIGRTAFQMADLLDELGFDRDLPVLGYVFRDDWAEANSDLLASFDRALRAAKTELGADESHWDAIRPLMRAPEPSVFGALREGFVAGTPQPLDTDRIADLQRLLVLTGTPQDEVMPASLFYRQRQ